MAVPEAVIRPAVPADLEAVAEIYAHYVSETVITFDQTPPTVADWQGRLDDLAGRGLPFLVADLNDEVVGYAYAGPWRPKPAYRYTVEDSIYLASDRTGRGLGGALLGTLLPRCAQAGMRQMIAVIADTGNGASTALHERFGFAPAGRLTGVGHKHGRSIDTLLMQRALTTD
ncbi:GNAT family N-acetyltransferase [Actinoallomurus iriomotensis]|uniref:Phosphinothricin N-acetyltransferase n=1 Tax=Actinoallomurus iriomotensis TaxID=478107 RepID=A0A9W6RT06_9ACTN|nr:GNAT family N-acetyltransferase [Actinoallomurus iriomotensis]GLY81178.1 phosphinothricin N-acetyltransferase [Actinoallomurus iriomotensis]